VTGDGATGVADEAIDNGLEGAGFGAMDDSGVLLLSGNGEEDKVFVCRIGIGVVEGGTDGTTLAVGVVCGGGDAWGLAVPMTRSYTSFNLGSRLEADLGSIRYKLIL